MKKIISLLALSLMSNIMFSSCAKKQEPLMLENCSWEEISKISQADTAQDAFKIGDTKIVKINGIDHLVRIIDFNHDKNSDGQKIGITFEFVNVICDDKGIIKQTWNGDNPGFTNYDFINSTLNTFLNGTKESTSGSALELLPEDLRKEIKIVDKKVGIYDDKSKSYVAVSYYPKLFLLAHDEITKHEEFATENEGETYQYYLDHSDTASYIKKPTNKNHGSMYWLRSPGINHNNNAWRVDEEGLIDCKVTVHSFAGGIAPAFCI